MKTTLIIASMLILASCGPSKEEAARQGKESSGIKYYDTPRGISVQKVDGCEYVYCEVVYGVAIVHKQNCKNH